MKRAYYIIIILIMFASCGENEPAANNKTQPTRQAAGKTVSQERANPSPQPATIFSEKINSELGRLNNWTFKVALYETHKTFTYRLQVQYAEMNITDSLQLPDLGLMPQPVLKKGNDEYSCIIGFMDNKNTFRDYKLVKVTNGNVRIHTLKYYSVQHYSTKQD